MKPILPAIIILLLATVLSESCSKNGYSTADHTTGLVNVTRSWSGYSTGYAMGDTLIPPATAPQVGALYFNHTISDTSFSINKINGFQISVGVTPMNYLSTDATTQIVEFDTTLAGTSAVSFLKYDPVHNSMTLEYHQVGAYNNLTGHYYETNISLHTN